MMRFLRHRIIVFCGGVVLGTVGSFFFRTNTVIPYAEQREFNSKYQLINPLLACGDDSFSHLSNRSLIQVEQKTQTFIDEQKRNGTLLDGAVYFRELNGGPWFGVNEDALFVPGSLLKVPLVMSIYAKAEKDPKTLTQTIFYEAGVAPAVEHYASEQIQIGKTYGVEDLVKAVLVHSDNNAALLLSQLISKGELDASYENLGITIPTQGQDYTMSVRTYASFFRILFNATYITHEYSEHLLKMLTETTFVDGIVGGVPSGTVVAHKFGERSYGNSSALQLHDCGIVYKPNHPYLLCLMMRGNDFDTLAKRLQEISKLIYSYAE